MSVEWVSFDCYGTLIDWEGGVADALSPLLPRPVDRAALAQRYIALEAELEADEYVAYADVLDRTATRLLREHGVTTVAEHPLSPSLPEWRPFPEVPDALRSLRARGRKIAILSNVDRDLLARSIERIGVAPDLAITAEDCRSYKPAPGHWQELVRRTGAGPERTIHVGASQYHDMRPAAALGYRTVFINRNAEPLETAPSRVLPDLAGLPGVIDELEGTD